MYSLYHLYKQWKVMMSDVWVLTGRSHATPSFFHTYIDRATTVNTSVSTSVCENLCYVVRPTMPERMTFW